MYLVLFLYCAMKILFTNSLAFFHQLRAANIQIPCLHTTTLTNKRYGNGSELLCSVQIPFLWHHCWTEYGDRIHKNGLVWTTKPKRVQRIQVEQSPVNTAGHHTIPFINDQCAQLASLMLVSFQCWRDKPSHITSNPVISIQQNIESKDDNGNGLGMIEDTVPYCDSSV